MAKTNITRVPAQPGLPRLYSFRRCPYAIRSRLAIQASGVQVELREVLLRSKPPQMLDISSKGTVPVLHLSDGRIIDESRDIIDWALSRNDPHEWALAAQPALRSQAERLIDRNDGEFKNLLDRYKYAVRFPEHPPEYYRDSALQVLAELDRQLNGGYLLDGRETIADVALYPFVRQFALVDKPWFDRQPMPALQAWLEKFLADDSFARVMVKLPPWSADQPGVVFPWPHLDD